MTEDFLSRMAAASNKRLSAAKSVCDESCMQQIAEQRPAAVPLHLSPKGFDLIAEVKKRSPSAGELANSKMSPVEQARHYSVAGAAAISVLTEPEQFAGEIEDLKLVTASIKNRPAMRKDFLVSPYQIFEARAAGAGGVLLIAAMLYAAELREMLQLTSELGMFALVEAFDEVDLDNCLPVLEEMTATMNPADRPAECSLLVGVNCRNLRSLQVEFSRFEGMVDRLPAGIPWVAESGIESPAQAAQVSQLGYSAALVGTALMRAGDPGLTVAQMISAGRENKNPG